MKCKKRGRPIVVREKKQRHQVTIHAKIADILRNTGDGNLSQGIALLAKRYQGALEVAKYVSDIPVPYTANSPVWAACSNCHADYIGVHTCGDRFTSAHVSP